MSALRQASRLYKEVWNLSFVLQKSGFSRRGYWSDQVKLVNVDHGTGGASTKWLPADSMWRNKWNWKIIG